MKKSGYILLILTVIIAFWQVFFLQNGMKWDFVDAFLPSRYFFTESILNNQFPLWNPYLLYGTPIYADLVSVFNPEFWIVGNMFGYSNITLQFVFLVYIFIAGISFFYFLKQFDTDRTLALGLSVAYMLSGFVIGNSQHVAFVAGYALIPFLIACYLKFTRNLNKVNFVCLAIALFLMVYCSYPALTIISAYFILTIFVWYLYVNRKNKNYVKIFIGYHFALLLLVILFSAPLILAYFQLSPFLSRFSGLPPELAQKHSFSVQSILSYLTPMAAGNDPQYFQTDKSISNGYWGIFSIVLFMFALTKKPINKESYLILFFGVFSLLASFGDQFFLRELLYKYAPLMNRFQYPGIFRAFTIFSFLAFTGINCKAGVFNQTDRKRLMLISCSIIILLVFLLLQSWGKIEDFAYFKSGIKFQDELFNATRFDNIIFQGIVQITFLAIFILLTWKLKDAKNYMAALLFLFVADGIVTTQLSTHYTVLSKTDPLKFYNYLKSSPKGFPIPDLNPIAENTDRNAANEFTWLNNNVFPKKVTFDGLVSFKTDGYRFLSDNHPELLEAIKKEPVVYFSDDIRENSLISDFKPKTVFLQEPDYKILLEIELQSAHNDTLEIVDFSPTKIEVNTNAAFSQLLVYQQNYYTGWKVFVDGIETDLLKSNFTHMAVLVPAGAHTILFKYSNKAVIFAFFLVTFIFIVLIIFSIKFFIAKHPGQKKPVIIAVLSLFSIFVLISGSNRYLYQKNKLGLSQVIIEKAEKWKSEYKTDIRILLSTQQKDLKKLVNADALCFINEKTNVAELSDFLMDSKSRYFAFAWQGGIIGDELFELISSFYPVIVEKKKRNNSGIYLFEKTGGKQEYDLTKSFEPATSPDWNQIAARTKVDSLSGNHSYYYNENEEFGTSTEFRLTKEMLEYEKITVLVDFKFEDNLAEALLVFTSDRNGEMKIYQTLDLSKFAKYANKWCRAVYEVQIHPEITEGDIVKIYFWNIKKAKFQIDNFKLKIGNSQ